MKKSELSNTRFAAIAILVALTAVTALLSTVAVWSKQQALDTDTWTAKSGELLDQKPVRDAVAHFVVKEIDAYVDLDRQLQDSLPDTAAPFAGPLGDRIRATASRTVSEALRTDLAKSLWRVANQQAHEAFVAALNGDSAEISTKNGDVVLNLTPLIDLVSERLSLGTQASSEIPADAGKIVLFHSGELKHAQVWTRSLERFAVILPILTLLFGGFALLLARDRRRTTLIFLGIGLATAGGATLLARDSLRTSVVDQSAHSVLNRSAAAATWDVGTSLLVDIATGVIVAGAALVVAGALLTLVNRLRTG